MLRIATTGDIPQILSIYAPYILHSTATFEYTVPTQDAFTQRFLDITAQYPWLVWEEEGQILGYAYASAPYTRAAYSWCAEPSVYLRPEAQGKGIGTALYAVLEQILKYQGYQVLYALITQENTPSLSFHTRLDYKVRVLFPDCGYKFDRWLGLYWLEKRLTSVETPSDFPISWSAIREDAQKSQDILDILSLS